MRKPRENLPNRVYRLISRIAHRAFYLNAAERDRFVDMKMLYRPTRFKELKREWDKLAERPKSAEFRAFRESFLRRMWNMSAFMQTLKQHFTMSFNGRRGGELGLPTATSGQRGGGLAWRFSPA